jgi:hypothetical protein
MVELLSLGIDSDVVIIGTTDTCQTDVNEQI